MSMTRIRIGPADQGRAMSMEEFREAEETPGFLYELARGVVDVVEIPSDGHAQIVDNVHELFSTHRRQHPGRIVRIAHGSDLRLLIFEMESDRHPDLAVVFRGARLNRRGRQLPDLVVEVVSPGARAKERDFVEKAEEYLRLEIAEYWIVEPERKELAVLEFQRDEAGPSWRQTIFRRGDTIQSLLLPGFAGTVADLWVDVHLDEKPA